MSIYDITIAGVGGAAPSDGFIDHKTVYQYTNASSGDVPSSFANSKAKSRANARHRSVVNAIQFYTGLKIIDVTAGGSPNCNTAPSSMVYRVEIDNIANVRIPNPDDGPAYLEGEDAVKYIISLALMKSETRGLEILDPTTAAAPGNATLAARTGPRFESTVVGPLYTVRATAEASVSIALVP